MFNGWCDFAIHRPVAAHKFWLGNKGRDAVVLHVSEGTVESLIGWFLGSSPTSAHFGIGPDGALYQFVSVHDSAFANGATYHSGRWHDPTGRAVTPAWPGLRPPINPNRTTISVERAGRYYEPWTDAARDTHVRLLAWLAERFPSLAPYEPGRTLIGHRDISPVERANCPGPHVDIAAVAAVANAYLVRAATASDEGAAARVALRPISPELIPGGEIVTEQSLILAPPRATVAQAARFMLARPHGGYSTGDIVDHILPAYWQLCSTVGIDPLVAVAQMIHETGNLSSPLSQRPHRNPAGIGVTGESGKEVSFRSWEGHSIPAHIGRLLAYALREEQTTPVQRRLIRTALKVRALPEACRGSARTLKALGRDYNPSGQGWASPGTHYGARIAAIANAIRRQPGA